jgi:O-antigen/teichoic acid export membrane protein
MNASVSRRFAFTVGANLLRSLLSFATAMLVARWLEPQAFGRMAFLLGTFVALRQLMDMGSSMAFFTFMSQRLRSRGFVSAYLAWLGLQLLLPLFVIGLLFPAEWVSFVWHGEPRGLVLLALVAAFMQNSVWPVLQQAGESQRRTLPVQTVGVTIVALHFMVVLALWAFGKLGLYTVLAATAIEYLIGALFVRRMLAYQEGLEPARENEPSLMRQYLRYCLPMIPYTWVAFAYEFADRWLLQQFGGSVQQAYYAVSAQFAAIALIATTSILNIFWKEVAEAHHRGDHARTSMLYRRVSRLLFLTSATIAGYLCFWAEDLLRLLLGTAYVGGATTLAIMFLYPVHQSMGQIGSTMLYATERVSLQVGTGIAFMALSILVTYFVLAPTDALVPGFGLASVGLAAKMVLLQLVQVNVIAWIIARLWRWHFDWTHQPVALLSCILLGWLAHAAALELGGTWPTPALMALGALIYLIMMAALVWTMPWLAGIPRAELRADVSLILRRTRFGLKSK